MCLWLIWWRFTVADPFPVLLSSAHHFRSLHFSTLFPILSLCLLAVHSLPAFTAYKYQRQKPTNRPQHFNRTHYTAFH
uniref:Putative secreted peptide n=1 Tax=Anopheles braziliensis TaxID=58242 RepID=A0A2M3ZPI6_9DIPT